MRIDGEWFECDDGFVRPVVRGEILNAHGIWEPTPFLLDTGADCTVFSAAILDVLGFKTNAADHRLGGVGGVAESVQVTTKIQLRCDNGKTAVFRGQYAAFWELESLDMSVLGREIMDIFAVIVDRPNNVVTLIRQDHQYAVNQRGA